MKYKQLQMLIEASYTRASDRPRFQPHVFLSFGKSTIPANEGKKTVKTLGSCKQNAHWRAKFSSTSQGQTSIVLYST